MSDRELEDRIRPPPPYSPQRLPPPYASKENKSQLAPPIATPFTSDPLSVISPPTTAVIHPRPSSPPVIIVTSMDGINPSVGPNELVSSAIIVKKAETAEPYEEFCPRCQCRIRTRQNFVTGRLTWFLVIIILILFFPLAFLPFLVDSCKDVQHYCPKCSTLIAVKKRFFF